MTSQELQVLENFEKDSEWFHKNIVRLQKEGFVGKFVAIKDSKPIVSDKNIDTVIKEIEKRGENPSYIFIEFVHPEGFTLIL
ncbi:hypothetical protein HYT25_03080 [Candidatus Pacearchaeota archaeon]|nr:hypothetical protein [Candidatus Pacearchaeota archaeon]